MSWNSNIRLDDCVELYEKKNTYTIINDGRIVGFERIEDEENNSN